MMKKWRETQEKFWKMGKGIQSSWEVLALKIQAHAVYRSLQSKIGKKRMQWLNATFIFLLLVAALTHCGPSENEDKKAKPPVPIIAAKIKKGDVPLYLKSIGTVTPIEGITVRTQINGRIVKVNFEEGQIVQKGQVLVEIDPAPYEALLKQYEGQLIRDQALLHNARIDLARYKKLYAQDSVSQQTLETQIYLVQQYEGTVASDQGLVDSAKVNLEDCRITSDISGMIGLRYVNLGNFVQTTDTTFISTVNMISPITVVFPIPEDDLGKLQEKARNNTPLAVEAFDRKEEKILAAGQFLAMDSQIDNTTGTIKLKAVFANEEARLFPNQFVNIRLKLGMLSDVLIVPTAAIQMGREGPFLYLVDEEKKTVSVKKTTVQVSEGGASCIMGDVKEGQSVVIQGVDKLSEGSRVVIVHEKEAEAAADVPAKDPAQGPSAS